MATNLQHAENAWDHENTQRRALEDERRNNEQIILSQEANLAELRNQLAAISSRYAADQETAKQSMVVAQETYESLQRQNVEAITKYKKLPKPQHRNLINLHWRPKHISNVEAQIANYHQENSRLGGSLQRIEKNSLKVHNWKLHE